MMLEPEVETRPWDEQLALDDASYRRSSPTSRALALLPEKLAGWASVGDAAGGLADIAELPLTEKAELRATGTAGEPVRRAPLRRPRRARPHLLDERHDGTPSYIPLTAGDLDNWVTGSARSYAASGIAPGSGSSRRTTPGRSWPARRSRPSTGSASCTSRSAPGTRSACCARSSACGRRRPSSRRRTRRTSSMRPSADSTCAASSVERVLVAGEPGGGEPAFRARLEEGWGARVTEAMGIGDIGVSLWGECEEQDGMHLGARGFVHAELIDPDTGRPRRCEDGAPASSCSRISGTGPRRSSASARATTSRCGRARARAAAPARGCAASGGPTTCSSSAASTSSRRRSVTSSEAFAPR